MTISANGTYNYAVPPFTDVIIAASGTFGGGALAVNYSQDGVAAYEAITTADGALTLTTVKIIVLTTPSPFLQFVLTGATNPSILLNINGVS